MTARGKQVHRLSLTWLCCRAVTPLLHRCQAEPAGWARPTRRARTMTQQGLRGQLLRWPGRCEPSEMPPASHMGAVSYAQLSVVQMAMKSPVATCSWFAGPVAAKMLQS